jgi:hypothetical protein
MKKFLIVFVFLFVATHCFSQDSISNIRQYLHEEVYKNIAAYNIRFCGVNSNGVLFESRLRTGSRKFYDAFFPPMGCQLKLEIDSLGKPYPVSDFILYRVHQNGFEYQGPKNKPGLAYSQPFGREDYLVAVNPLNGDLKFVSGRFFLTDISMDFKLNWHEPASFIPYLELRSFEIGGRKFSLKKQSSKLLVFTFYSTVYKSTCELTIGSKDYDETTTHVLSPGNRYNFTEPASKH